VPDPVLDPTCPVLLATDDREPSQQDDGARAGKDDEDRPEGEERVSRRQQRDASPPGSGSDER
jgi:hypothetical protein